MSHEALLTFPKGGIHPPESKQLSHHLPIENLPLPEEVDVPLVQHFGAPAKTSVAKKDKVTEGDLLGSPEGMGANVHASLTGTVKMVETSPNSVGVSIPSVTIQRDPAAEPRAWERTDWRGLTGPELLERIKAAGIVGMGGAGFPAHVKLSPPAGVKVDTLILNGVECEPYLTTDHRLMLEEADQIVEGMRILLAVLGIRRGHVGIEANKMDAVRTMREAAARATNGVEITVEALKVKYPQGAERQLIQSVTGRKVPAGGLPFHVGVVVQNTGTTRAIYDAVALGKPLYEKVITVSGRGIARPANLRVRIGTRLADIIKHLGGTTPDLARIVLGGPMTGFSISSLEMPVTKMTSGVLFLTEEEIDREPYGNCIRCGWCVDVCPMGLEPCQIGAYVEAGKPELTAPFGVFECFECGSCAYVCPAKRPIVQFVRLGKMKARR